MKSSATLESISKIVRLRSQNVTEVGSAAEQTESKGNSPGSLLKNYRNYKSQKRIQSFNHNKIYVPLVRPVTTQPCVQLHTRFQS